MCRTPLSLSLIPPPLARVASQLFFAPPPFSPTTFSTLRIPEPFDPTLSKLLPLPPLVWRVMAPFPPPLSSTSPCFSHVPLATFLQNETPPSPFCPPPGSSRFSTFNAAQYTIFRVPFPHPGLASLLVVFSRLVFCFQFSSPFWQFY